jgi:hypothetical protein
MMPKPKKMESVSKNWKGLNGGIVWLDLCSPYQQKYHHMGGWSLPAMTICSLRGWYRTDILKCWWFPQVHPTSTYLGYSPCSVALFIWLRTTKANITWTIWHTNNFIQKNVNQNTLRRCPRCKWWSRSRFCCWSTSLVPGDFSSTVWGSCSRLNDLATNTSVFHWEIMCHPIFHIFLRFTNSRDFTDEEWMWLWTNVKPMDPNLKRHLVLNGNKLVYAHSWGQTLQQGT